jgi:chemotaxis response regulator CheB
MKRGSEPDRENRNAPMRVHPPLSVWAAGGLEAFTELLTHVPTDTGLAFVLIQHLDPNHPSHLTEVLSRVTKCLSPRRKPGLAPKPITST